MEWLNFRKDGLSYYAETILPNFISAYKKSGISNHVLLRLTENWKKSRNKKKFVGTVLIDHSKAFNCIPSDLLTAKHHAYVFSEDAVTFVYSYLKRRKLGKKTNDDESVFELLLSGIPEGSTLGPIQYQYKWLAFLH